MKVVIAGGGIAGLTFANALEQAGIDYVLLEARPLLDPQVGASIGLGPGSLRIYDQFGAAQEIIDQTTPLVYTQAHDRNGKKIAPRAPVFELLTPRLGYGFCFLDRQLVLRAATNAIKHQEKLLVNKRLASIDHSDTGVKVNCEDGTSYSGDIVVGCDGVNSKVRSEMWRIASDEDPSFFSPEEKTKLGAEFTCLFGISHHVSGFDEEGCAWQTYDKGTSFLLITGKDCRLYWFFFQKLDKVYKVSDPDFPKYTKKDAEEVAEKNAYRPCHERATLGDVWEKRISYTLVPMEEALFDKWSYKRMATIGDNSHKMTANHGQAGNNAIESAAALANQLKRIHDADKAPDLNSITHAFSLWREKRRVRVDATYKEAALICRMQALDNFFAYIFEFWIVPLLSDIVINMQTDTMRGAELLEWLPVPERAFEGNMPFSQYQGVGKKESLLVRALKASPLLVISAVVAWKTGGRSLDAEMLRLLQPTSTNNADWISAFIFMTNEATIYSLWLIENHRRANRVAPARLTWIFGILASMFGFGVVAPIWFFLHYIFSAVDNFAAGDMRLTNLAYTRTILPVNLGFVVLPLVLKGLGIDIPISTGTWRWIWTFSVLSITLIQNLLIKMGLSKDTTQKDAISNCLADLPTLRCTSYIMATASILASWALPKFLGNGLPSNSQDDLLYFNRLGTSSSSLLWLAILFFDLNRAGMADFNLIYLAGIGAGIAAGIPIPAIVAVGFAWREQILATKRAKHSIIKEKFLGKSVLEVDPEAIAQPEAAKLKAFAAEANGHVNGHVKSVDGSTKGSCQQM